MLSGGTFKASAMAGTAVFRIVVSSDSMKNPTATSHGSSRLAVSVRAISSRVGKRERCLSACERCIDDALRLCDQPAQVFLVMETLGVDLVDIFGSRGPRGKPAAARGDFHAADGRIVAGCTRENLFDGVAGKFRKVHLCGVELGELLFLFRIRRGVDAICENRAQIPGH